VPKRRKHKLKLAYARDSVVADFIDGKQPPPRELTYDESDLIVGCLFFGAAGKYRSPFRREWIGAAHLALNPKQDRIAS
jgi:hypothetical protein